MSATTIGQVHKTSSGTKPLWIAVGALGAAVLAMGASLVYLQARPADSRITPMPAIASMQTEAGAAPLNAPVKAAINAPVDSLTTSGAAAAAPQAVMKQDEAEKPVAAPVKKAPVATKAVASKSDKAATSTPAAHASSHGAGGSAPVAATGGPAVVMDNPVVAAQPVRPVCGNCGTVEAATPIQREGAGTGLGAVAGGVLGAVVGNQVGGGNGRTAATVLGALGGGWAGNTVEKKMKKDTVYQVRVRMEDGGSRTFEVATPVNAGSHVTVEGGSLRLADGSLASPLPSRPQRQTQSSPNPIQTGG
jgi:outer membrane lipoprotein SlyB